MKLILLLRPTRSGLKITVSLGRGRPIVRYQGNIRFRKLIQNRMKAYRDAYRHISKDAIAQEVVDVIISRGGRFLRRVESVIEAAELAVPQGAEAWKSVDRDAAICKCKQAFRDEKRAISGVKELGGAQGLDSPERSSDHDESNVDVAVSTHAQRPSLPLGEVVSLVSQQQQQHQQKFVYERMFAMSAFDDGRRHPSRPAVAISQAEADLLFRALQAHQTGRQVPWHAIADRIPHLSSIPPSAAPAQPELLPPRKRCQFSHQASRPSNFTVTP